MTAAATAWEHGRFDAGGGRRKILFGQMYEDAAIELAAFEGRRRVFCIASAGCTALQLAARHEVVAVDINPVQLAYAARRIAGEPPVRGTAERVMDAGRVLAPLFGWRRARVSAFLELDDPPRQIARFREELDTRRFRVAFDALLSALSLRAIYAPQFLDFLPARMGAVLRGRLERCFARHPNRTNPYARALLLGELSAVAPPEGAKAIQLACSDAAGFLEAAPAGSFDGFALSNILDGARPGYRERLSQAVRRAAAPGAMAVLRSFGEPPAALATNRAADDRSMLWGIVDVRPAAELG